MNEERTREHATDNFVAQDLVTHDARSIEEQPINALSMLR